jgi:hypothetical protein
MKNYWTVQGLTAAAYIHPHHKLKFQNAQINKLNTAIALTNLK